MLWKQVNGLVFSGGPRKTYLCQRHLNWDHRDALSKQCQWWEVLEKSDIGDETLLINLFIHPERIMCQYHSQPWDVRRKE